MTDNPLLALFAAVTVAAVCAAIVLRRIMRR